MTRHLALYLRSRSGPATLATMLGCTAGLWALVRTVEDPYLRDRLVLLTTVVAVAAVAPGLTGADTDLDKVAGFAWQPRRAAHLVIACACTVALLASAAAGTTISTATIARDTAGLTGLTGIGAATLGAGRAPLPSLLWTAVAIGVPPANRPAHRVILTWMTQPAGTATATLVALILAAAGVVAYAVAGPRPGAPAIAIER